MQGLRYIVGVSTLQIDWQGCIGCGQCVIVCPHRLFSLEAGALRVSDFDLCMECGACARNCPVQAISVSAGVGCASALIHSWLERMLGRKGTTRCC